MAPDIIDTKYHLVRAIEEATTAGSGLHTFVQNTCALLLGYFSLRRERDFTNKIADYVLLTNFPDLSSRWCIAPGGQRTSRLQDTQDYYLRLALLVTGLLRWPGWYLFGLPLFECVRYTIILYTICQLLIIGLLLIIHGLTCIGLDLAALTEWKPSAPTESNSRKEKKVVHFDSPAIRKSKETEMSRKHPSSVSMGRFLQSLPPGPLERANFYSPRKRKQVDSEMEKNQQLSWDNLFQSLPEAARSKIGPFSPRTREQEEPKYHESKVQQLQRSFQQPASSDLFIIRELNVRTQQTETMIYHSITTHENLRETSFEELRIEHYARIEGLSIASLPSLDTYIKAIPLPITESQTETVEEEDEEPTRSTLANTPPPIAEPQVEAEDSSISDLLKSSMRQIALPSWLSSRMSRDAKTTSVATSPAVTDWESPATTLVPSSTPPGLPPISAQQFWGRSFT
ncbi:hypothetical protein CKM354_001092300 [Cercospora kikuchii]|uniref:Uncharacterized protein n=1 Tax=Cercospora kikuchii TaxID=84275 RepID=A0A9P3CRY3_9PEZI|nr:uncharacterized protein CKM354_001092300 [Cercospora kikuchii]GIZ47843.1 hypothetical protein CKM354_001092300 [Cercospora kikuchii]